MLPLAIDSQETWGLLKALLRSNGLSVSMLMAHYSGLWHKGTWPIDTQINTAVY